MAVRLIWLKAVEAQTTKVRVRMMLKGLMCICIYNLLLEMIIWLLMSLLHKLEYKVNLFEESWNILLLVWRIIITNNVEVKIVQLKIIKFKDKQFY